MKNSFWEQREEQTLSAKGDRELSKYFIYCHLKAQF